MNAEEKAALLKQCGIKFRVALAALLWMPLGAFATVLVAAEAGELWSMEDSEALKEQRRSRGGLLFLMIVGAALANFAISSGALLAATVEWRLLMATAVDVGKKAVAALKSAGTLIEKGLAAIVIVSERDEEALRTRAKVENEKTGAKNGS